MATAEKALRWTAVVVVLAGFSLSLACLGDLLGYFRHVPGLGPVWPLDERFRWICAGFMAVVFVLSLAVWRSWRWIALVGLAACFLWLLVNAIPVL